VPDALRQRLGHATGRLHLIYLGLLPSLATFALTRTYGFRLPAPLFFVGVAEVGVYIVTVYSYTRLSSSPWLNLAALLDGPLFVLAARRLSLADPFGFAIEAYLVDGFAIWVSILGLAIVSPLPTRGQRIASVAIMLAISGVTGWLVWPYVPDVLWGSWGSVAWLSVGFVEAVAARLWLFARGDVARDHDDFGILYTVFLVLAWVVAMTSGLAVHRAG